MLTIKDAVRVVNVIKTTAEKVKSSETKLSDIMILSEINPEVRNNMLFLKKWFNGEIKTSEFSKEDNHYNHNNSISRSNLSYSVNDAITFASEPYKDIEPDSVWKPVFSLGVAVSDKGTIYSMKKHAILKTYFIDGDLRVYLDDDDFPRRAAPIVCRAFQIYVYSLEHRNRNFDYIIKYVDGDRRNISPDNLCWVKKTQHISFERCYIEDICRRIVEFNGDVDEILKQYEGSKPVTTKKCIEMIMYKELHPIISDNFFNIKDGVIIPVNESSDKNFILNDFVTSSDDNSIKIEAIKDKIKAGQMLNYTDKIIIAFSVIESFDSKSIPDVNEISNIISDKFKIDVPTDLIEQVRSYFNLSDINELKEENKNNEIS